MELSLAHILPAIIWALLLGLIAWKTSIWGKEMLNKSAFLGVFMLKICVGAFVWLIYTHYYTDKQTSDIYRFFADSEVIYNTLFHKPLHYFQLVFGLGGTEAHQPYFEAMNNWYKSFDDGFINENRSLIRYNALLMPFTRGSYFGNMVITCFLGVWAQAFLYQQLRKRTGKKWLLFILLNLWPSQLFWTSALMKEPLVMAGIALSVGAALKLKEQKRIPYLILCFIGIVLTLFSKFYIGIALCFPLLAFLVQKEHKRNWQLVASYGLSICLLVFMAWGLGKIWPQFDIPQIIAAKQHAFSNVAKATQAGSAFEITPLSPSVKSMLLLAPEGLWNSLARPYPQDANGMMEWAAIGENILFILLALYFLLRINSRSKHVSLAVAFVMFALIILVLGGITVNISGALVRYKMPAIPYLTIGLFLVSQVNEKLLPKAKNTLIQE